VDNNQSEIVEILRARGFSVAHTHMVGKGFVDVVAGKWGLNFLCEIKDGSLPPSKRVLTPQEQDFHNAWRGQICILENADDVEKITRLALNLATAIKKEYGNSK